MSASTDAVSGIDTQRGSAIDETGAAGPEPMVTPDIGLPGTHDELKAIYKRQIGEYESMIREAIELRDTTKIPSIRAKAEQIQTSLNKMIENITYLKRDTPDIQIERADLLGKLRQIQKDYSDMIVNVDDLETLRRIRKEESEEGETLLYRYLAFFVLLACILVVYTIVVGFQRSAVRASTPTMMPILT
jgi:hypothetical protein